MKRLIATLLMLIASAPSLAEDLVLASWNIQNIGWGENKHYEALGRIGADFDFIAVQEVMNREGLYGLWAALEAETGERWGKQYSHAIGRGRYREKYAFLYRKSRVLYVDGAVVFLDREDLFAREPFAARFESTDGQHRFVAATVHILYGQRKADRLPEIEALTEMWRWLEESFGEEDMLLMGDFNLRPNHQAFRPLRQVARPLTTRGATTLSTIDGRYANLYDHIWLSNESSFEILEHGIVRFPQMLGWTHEEARRHTSDHAPVFVRIASRGPFPPRTKNQHRLVAGAMDPPPFTLPGQATASEGGLRGNRNSNIYHHPDCPGYSVMAEHNRVYFATEEAARQAGMRRARNCDWPD